MYYLLQFLAIYFSPAEVVNCLAVNNFIYKLSTYLIGCNSGWYKLIVFINFLPRYVDYLRFKMITIEPIDNPLTEEVLSYIKFNTLFKKF